MASLVGQQLKDTYDSLLKTSDNDALGGTYKEITDGAGNGSGLYLGTGGRVGIGTTSPDASLHVETTAISGAEQIAKFTVSDDSTSYLKIANGTGSNNTFNPSIQTLSSGTNTSRFDIATITTDTGSAPAYVIDSRLAGGALTSRPILDVRSYGNTKMLIDASGNLDMSAGGGNIILDSGAGIDFSDTPNSSGTMTSELLDDYEEGSTNATFTATTSGTITANTSLDRIEYTKIGDICHVQGTVYISSVLIPVGNVQINCLPFLSQSKPETADFLSANVVFYDGTTYSQKEAIIGPNAQYITVYMDASTLVANDRFFIQATYKTA